jgi:hypothetical protein
MPTLPAGDDAGPHRAARVTLACWTVALAAAAAAFSFGTADAAGSLNRNLVPSHGALLGAMAPNVPRFERKIRHRIAVEHSFYSWKTVFPDDHERWTARNGRIPLITWMPSTNLDAILSGRFDALIRARAVASKAFGRRYFLRFAHEMNGNWYPWDGSHNGNSPQRYVAAWRRIHGIFQSVGATNVVWVWSPHWSSFPTDPWNDFRNYYPGNGYVDWVAIDGYNHGSIGRWQWTPFKRIFKTVYGAYAGVKPIMIAETGSVEQGGSKARWIRNARWNMKLRLPGIKAFIWFHKVASYEGYTFDWRVNSSRSALRKFRRLAHDPYFEERLG